VLPLKAFVMNAPDLRQLRRVGLHFQEGHFSCLLNFTLLGLWKRPARF
jgi:hypothetical protein